METARTDECVNMSGTVASILYRNDENGYTVCEVEQSDALPVVFVGSMAYISEGDSITAVGKWETHSTYGKQFKVVSYERNLPTTDEDVCRYLSGGTIKGIGPKTAKRIVAEFGSDAFDVIENHHGWLTKISGISPKKAAEIHDSFTSIANMRSLMMLCGEHVPPAATMRIYKRWGGSAVERIRENPYCLCGDICGIGFIRADALADSLGISKDSPDRIAEGLCYALTSEAVKCGHTCLAPTELVQSASALLSVAPDKVDAVLRTMIADGRLMLLHDGETSADLIFIPSYYNAELYIAKKLESIRKMCPVIVREDVERLILQSETETGMTYAAEQRHAITAALESGVMILTGGPGTGKTTVIKCLISIFTHLGLEVALAAPTGRAAKRMSEATSTEARTVHRLLEMEYNDKDTPQFKRCETDYLDEDVIIIDEASMLDTLLTESLLRAVKPGARLIIIGDIDQLPSVGAGNVLSDLIASEHFSTVRLTEIFRQAKESLIVTNAHAINNGNIPDLTSKNNDFFFLNREWDENIAPTIADLCKNRLPKSFGRDITSKIQVITPSKKGDAGTESLNQYLQEALNPHKAGIMEKKHHGVLFREGDKVMQVRNNYTLEWTRGGKDGAGIFNGDIGVIDEIDNDAEMMRITFDERETLYEFSDLDDLDHAYAITVHKSQGSEYPVVIIPMYSCPPMLRTRNLFYTAVTRAENMVILVGHRDIVANMVANKRQSIRHTGLLAMMRHEYGEDGK